MVGDSGVPTILLRPLAHRLRRVSIVTRSVSLVVLFLKLITAEHQACSRVRR